MLRAMLMKRLWSSREDSFAFILSSIAPMQRKRVRRRGSACATIRYRMGYNGSHRRIETDLSDLSLEIPFGHTSNRRAKGCAMKNCGENQMRPPGVFIADVYGSDVLSLPEGDRSK